MKNIICILLLFSICQCKPKEDNTIKQFPGKPEMPSSIKKTHEYLLEQIHKITSYKDSSGRAAIKIEELMHHHFKEEEDVVLPLLGLLSSLANDQMPEQIKNIILLSEKVRPLMNHLSAEHQLIKAYLEELKQASDSEHRPEILEFEKEVSKHAISEEEVYFPAAILIGEYLKLKSAIIK